MKSAFAILAACLCAFAGPAPAETQAPASSGADPGKPLARSVFVLDDAGNATHLQTGWQCPVRFGFYQRHDLHLYDGYGLDVSCDYLKPGEGDITLYLTKRSGADTLQAHFEAGKQALVQRRAGAAALPDAEQKTFVSSRPWLHMLYTSDSKGVLDGVWYASYGDWSFELRVTFAQADEDAVFATMSTMTDAAHDVGTHLDRCAASVLPPRSGKAITDEKMLSSLATMEGIALAAGTTKDIDKKAPMLFAHPSEWCVEGSVAGSDAPVLMWHALKDDGSTADSDRASIATYEEPPVLTIARDPMLNMMKPGEAAALDVYVASLTRGDDTFIMGFFDGRPGGALLAQIFAAYEKGQARVYTSFNRKTNTITLPTPAATP